MMKADTSFNGKVKKSAFKEIMLIFVPSLKEDFSGDSDARFDSNNMALGVQSLGA